jgi:hypothetical protein
MPWSTPRASQRQGGDVPETVDPPAVGDLRPTERALERGGVQLVPFL